MSNKIKPKVIDALIVGAGFAGITAAEQLSKRLGWRCVIVDERSHIGGNAYDYVDNAGVMIHKYGPHYFRTNSDKVLSYLSQFTEWLPTEYNVKSYTEGKYWSFPINLNTFEQLIGRDSNSDEFAKWLDENKEEITNPQNSEDIITSQVGRRLYEMFFEGYTVKQWKKHPRDLDKSICGRIPIRTNRDDRYLREEFQAMPKDGYTALFEKMLEKASDTEVFLETSFEDAQKQYDYTHLVYTGPIDAFYDYCYGELPYRSLKFENESFTEDELVAREPISGKKGCWQPAMQVNYPSLNVDYTRIVEIKQATQQDVRTSTIVREYPADYEETGEPYYPVPTVSSKSLYKKYKDLADQEEAVSFIGRLGTYRYYNMDQVVAMALKESDKLCEKFGA